MRGHTRYTTSFVGRQQDIAEIVNLMVEENCRLLTLVGQGGIGKTRLVIEAIPHLKDQFLDGVFFVDLTTINTPEAIMPTIATTINFPMTPSSSSAEEHLSQIFAYLEEKELLLILDNFEHVLDGAIHISKILFSAPDVKIIVTSREVLNLQSEWIRTVYGLLYQTSNPTDKTELNPAMQLFADRARQFHRDFSLDHEYKHVFRICQLVEGMPLALELSAAWLRSLSCQAIGDEIQHNIDLLATRASDVPECHRSIRAIFANTLQNLSQNERDFLIRLSVFRGGFTYDIALQVAGGTLPLLAALTDQSLIRRELSERYSIQELLRQFANEQLHTMSYTSEVQIAHCQYYLNFLIEHEADIVCVWSNPFAADIENFDVAWDWAVVHGYYTEIQQSAWSFHIMHLRLGRDEELSAIYQTTLNHLKQDRPDGIPEIVFNYILALWGYIRGKSVAVRQQTMLQGINNLHSLGAQKEKVIAILHYLEKLYVFDNNLVRFDEQTREIYRIVRNLNQPVLTLFTLLRLSQLIITNERLNQFEEAKAYLAEILSLCTELDDQQSKAHALFELGKLLYFQSNFDVARSYFQQSLSLRIETNNGTAIANDLAWIGHTFMAEQVYDKARNCYQDMLVTAQDLNDRSMISFALHDLGWLAYCEKDYDQARIFFIRASQLAEYFFHKCSLIAGLASIQAFTSPDVIAVEHISMVLNDPSIWPRIKVLAEQGRAQLESVFLRDAYEAAWEHGKMLNAEIIFKHILESYFSQDHARPLLSAMSESAYIANKQLTDPLTERELEILHLVAEGYSNKEICDHLVISKNTVRTHLKNLYSKLNADSRTRAVASARELGLL